MRDKSESPECSNCGYEVLDCNCGDTEVYTFDEGPACPFCGNIEEAGDSEGHLYSEETTSWFCHRCEKEFCVSVNVKHSWNTSKPD